jgi:predicted phage terminase large subunit-like protein
MSGANEDGNADEEVSEPCSDAQALRAHLKRLSYLKFVEETIPEHWSAQAKHIKLIAKNIDLLRRGKIDRLAIHMPPRHGKSETITYRLPLKWLLDKGDANVLVTGYNERFARKLGRRTRNLSPEGFVSPSKRASDEWETTSGGLYMARGVGSPPTGTGFSLIVIDDPIKRREDAESAGNREGIWDWYSNDLYTRLEPGGAIVLVMTRWHEDDLGRQAVESEPGRWTVLKLAAIAEEDDPIGRKPGEALWPERYDAQDLERIRTVLSVKDGQRAWMSLYQQNPTPREGVFFKTREIEIIDADQVPKMKRKARAWDMAATAGGGDYTCGVLLGVDEDERYYVLDVKRGQWATDERNSKIKETAKQDGRSVRIRGPQDPSAAGKDAALVFTRLLAGYAVKTEPVSGSKELRADPFSAQVNAGNVRILRGEWNSAFLDELRSFPLGRHDDQVDAASDAFMEIVFSDETDRVSARPKYAAARSKFTGG